MPMRFSIATAISALTLRWPFSKLRSVGSAISSSFAKSAQERS